MSQRGRGTIQQTGEPTGMRLDKWLWAARFYKTRSLAADEVGRGRVTVNGQAAKSAREVRVGDELQVRQGDVSRTVVVRALSAIRGPAIVAQTMYEESAASLALRAAAASARRLASEPAHAITQGRPTKRDRRAIERTQVDWQRWSASIDST